jgi:hypothetical protein
MAIVTLPVASRKTCFVTQSLAFGAAANNAAASATLALPTKAWMRGEALGVGMGLSCSAEKPRRGICRSRQ